MTVEEIQGQFKHICNDVLSSLVDDLSNEVKIYFDDYIPYVKSDEYILEALETMVDENLDPSVESAIEWLSHQSTEERVDAIIDATSEYGVPDVTSYEGFTKLLLQGEFYFLTTNLMNNHADKFIAQAYALVYIKDKELNEKIADSNELEELLVKIAESDVEAFEDVGKIVDDFIKEK